MELQLQQTRDQQLDSWNKFFPGWKKREEPFMDFLKPMGNEIIRLIHSKKNQIVLDVASGTGELALTIASMLNNGKVVMIDLAADMLGIARENAIQRGIENYETFVCDVSKLPFADNTFDAISCRFGFMFFPDMVLAAKELVRVLKPGGKIATSVWNVPEKNSWITALMDTIGTCMELPAPEPNAPGMFRCADDGLMANLFLHAGLKNVLVKEVTGKMNCETPAVYWDVMKEVAAPVVALLSGTDRITKVKIEHKVNRILIQKYAVGKIRIESSALVIAGEK